ncbi:MAG: DUF3341 domain-containing protein [Chloroflexota bacterium]|nr:MAG: DUF3341 domain-containing protein [Chloroflexota bacterium]
MAQFEGPDDIVEAARRAYEKGYRRMDAYSPFPVEGLSEAVGMHQTRLPLIILAGGIAGALIGYGMQFYASVIDYPLNVGGRPLHSWPAFIPITFEMSILVAAFAAVLGMFALNGMPQPYHPVFNVPEFELASRESFFLAIEAADPLFDIDQTRQFLEELGAIRVSEIEN